MRSILKSSLGRASIALAVASAALVGAAASANAYDGRWHNHWGGHNLPRHEWREWHAWHGPYRGGYYQPYYYAPPPAYGYGYGYGAPQGLNLNFNVPL